MSMRVVPTDKKEGVDTRIRGHGRAFAHSDEILDFYLKDKSYFQQTLISFKTAIKSVWKTQVFVVGPKEAKSKLQNFWAATSLVSALLITVSFSYITAPVKSDDIPIIASIANVMGAISMILCLSVIVVSVIYTIEIDNATTDRDLRTFIESNASIFDLLTGIFSGSVLLLLGAAMLTCYLNFGQTEFIIVAVVVGVIALLGAAFAAIVAGRNRFILWARYGSEEGLKMITNLSEDEEKLLGKVKAELEFQTRQLGELKDLQELKELQEKLKLQGRYITSVREEEKLIKAESMNV